MKLIYSQEATTDSTGTYVILVSEDHRDELCDAMRVSNPHPTYRIPTDQGRDKAQVIFTRNNGIAVDDRFANNMGFMLDRPLAGCSRILQQYQDLDEYTWSMPSW